MAGGWRVEVFDMLVREWKVICCEHPRYPNQSGGDAIYKTREEAEEVAMRALGDKNVSQVSLIDPNGKRHPFPSGS